MTIQLAIAITSSTRQGVALSERLFDRGPAIDENGWHGGTGVPEYTDPPAATSLFDFGANINPRGFHGGTGVTE
jgi:hypothetical protein